MKPSLLSSALARTANAIVLPCLIFIALTQSAFGQAISTGIPTNPAVSQTAIVVGTSTVPEKHDVTLGQVLEAAKTFYEASKLNSDKTEKFVAIVSTIVGGFGAIIVGIAVFVGFKDYKTVLDSAKIEFEKRLSAEVEVQKQQMIDNARTTGVELQTSVQDQLTEFAFKNTQAQLEANKKITQDLQAMTQIHGGLVQLELFEFRSDADKPGTLGRAITLFESAVAVCSESFIEKPQALAQLAYAYKRLGRHQQALEKIELAMESLKVQGLPENETYLYNASCYSSILGQTEKSLGYLAVACDLYPKNIDFATTEPDFENIKNHGRFAQILNASTH